MCALSLSTSKEEGYCLWRKHATLSRTNLSKWIETISYQWKSNITRVIFKNWQFLFDFLQCKTICRNSKNTIFTFVLCVVIHKMCYTLAPEWSLETWNYGNITKNFARDLFCELIISTSTNFTLWAFVFWCIMPIIYNMIVRTCINRLILHSNFFHNQEYLSICAW